MNTRVLDEASFSADLFPFTVTRSVADIRIGILTLREKWELAGSPDSKGAANSTAAGILSLAQRIKYPWDIFRLNGEAISADFEALTDGRRSLPIPPTVQAISPDNIFIEEGASIQHCILNASTGPIYIGRNAEIMEGATIRGPFALCHGATVKMGAKIYGATTIGPHSIVGGEIKNSVIFGYSNKGHDGYLGDSVIGEWCNLGAGTSNSNLRNNAGEVKVWNERTKQFIPAGHKCGLLMGDYSRSSINTSFNTGTVVGVCCSIIAGPLTSKYIPSFSWGQIDRSGSVRQETSFGKYEFDLAIRDIGNWKKLKGQSLTEQEIQTLRAVFEKS
jgi:UDP-N-acetylglucosamine diphosphorylase / glucose-1-phosphate thymidylyltransferase / UDP-N-acetylgalactosamine diphosphorylase / glucosamine-1-phosphate N-acetyltransferase / galactosamine-1-phosphate N-acetyltransferase